MSAPNHQLAACGAGGVEGYVAPARVPSITPLRATSTSEPRLTSVATPEKFNDRCFKEGLEKFSKLTDNGNGTVTRYARALIDEARKRSISVETGSSAAMLGLTFDDVTEIMSPDTPISFRRLLASIRHH